MRFKDYSGTEQFRPLSAWAYFGYTILFAIPIIGWFFLLVFTFSTKNYNRRSFARSRWCGLIIAGIVAAILMATGVGAGWLYDNVPAVRSYLPEPKTTAAATPRIAVTPTEKAAPTGKAAPTEKAAQSAPTAAPATASGVSPTFKETMDGYEAFFDSYIEFMKGYDTSSTAPAQLLKYTEMMTEYAKTMEALEKIEETTLSEADDRYCTEVMLRINQKLAAYAAGQ